MTSKPSEANRGGSAAEEGSSAGSDTKAGLLSRGAWALMAQVVTSGGKFLVFLLVARALGPTGQGVFALALASATTAGMLLTLGLDTATTYHIGRSPGDTGRLLGNALAFGAAVTVLLAALAGPLILLTGAWWPPALTLVAAAVAAAHLSSVLLSGCLVGQRDFFGLFAGSALRYLGAIPPLLWLGDAVTATKALLVWLGMAVLQDAFLMVRAFTNDPCRLGLSRALLVRQLSFGLRTQMDRLANVLTYRLDLFLVGGMLGAGPAGLYSVAQQGAEALLLIPRGAGQVVLAEKSRGGRGSGEVRPIFVLTLGSVVVLASVLAAAAPWLIPLLFSDAFEASVPALRLLLLGVVLMTVGILAASHLIGTGRPGTSAFGGTVALVVTGALDLLLIPRWGIMGAATASVVAYGAYAAVTTLAVLAWRRR